MENATPIFFTVAAAPAQSAEVAGTLLCLIVGAMLLAALLTALLNWAERRVKRHVARQLAGGEPPLPVPSPPVRGFPVIGAEPDGPAAAAVPARPADQPFGPDSGPGRYRVAGVVHQTGTDTTLYIEADTLANAKVKAELRGVIVTDIRKT